MILETLDVKKNDIFIYSLNKFDFDNNFRLIHKDASVKHPVAIHYNDVCKFIADETPKSLVVYRLLTNVPTLDTSLFKFGFPVIIDGSREIIFFDPVYALKELEEYSGLDELPYLKFRIQQVGIILQLRSFGENKFSEVYSFDLEAEEIKSLNDRSFAEVIFAFDNVHFDEPHTPTRKTNIHAQTKPRFVTLTVEDMKSAATTERDEKFSPTLSHPPKVLTAEDLENEVSVVRPVTNAQPAAPRPQTNEQAAPPKTAEKQGASLSSFLNKVRTEGVKAPEISKEANALLDLFRSSAPVKDFVLERGKKQVVLRIKRK